MPVSPQGSSAIVSLAAGDKHFRTIGPYSMADIADLCRFFKDTNEHHISHEAAVLVFGKKRAVPEGKVVVPGLQIMGEFTRIVIDWLGQGTVFASIASARFPLPLFNDEAMIIEFLVKRVDRQQEDGAFVYTSVAGRIDGQEDPIFTATYGIWVPYI